MVVGTASVAFPEVHRFSEQQTGYFCRYALIVVIYVSISRLERYYYDPFDAAYTSPLPSHPVLKDEKCHLCASTTKSRHTSRFSLEQQGYHCHDFVLINSNHEGSPNDANGDDVGPCHIGQIIKIDDTSSDLLIRRLGRVDDIRPVGVKRDEVRYSKCIFSAAPTMLSSALSAMCSLQMRHLLSVPMISYGAARCSLQRKDSSTQSESRTFSFSYIVSLPGRHRITPPGPRNHHAGQASVIFGNALIAFNRGCRWIKSFERT